MMERLGVRVGCFAIKICLILKIVNTSNEYKLNPLQNKKNCQDLPLHLQYNYMLKHIKTIILKKIYAFTYNIVYLTIIISKSI